MGKGALAPCPPSNAMREQWWARDRTRSRPSLCPPYDFCSTTKRRCRRLIPFPGRSAAHLRSGALQRRGRNEAQCFVRFRLSGAPPRRCTAPGKPTAVRNIGDTAYGYRSSPGRRMFTMTRGIDFFRSAGSGRSARRSRRGSRGRAAPRRPAAPPRRGARPPGAQPPPRRHWAGIRHRGRDESRGRIRSAASAAPKPAERAGNQNCCEKRLHVFSLPLPYAVGRDADPNHEISDRAIRQRIAPSFRGAPFARTRKSRQGPSSAIPGLRAPHAFRNDGD